MFKLENATFYYNPKHIILENVTMDITAQKVGIIGSNGSGKTTFLKLMTQELRLQKGNIELSGRPYRTIYDLGYYRTFTLKELIHLAETLESFDTKQHDILMGGLGLTKYFDTSIENMSQGTSKKVGILFAMLSTADCLLFDEPFESLDQESQIFVRQYLSNTRKQFVLVDHHIELVQQLCDIVIHLDMLKEGEYVL